MQRACGELRGQQTSYLLTAGMLRAALCLRPALQQHGTRPAAGLASAVSSFAGDALDRCCVALLDSAASVACQASCGWQFANKQALQCPAALFLL
jgi:hypothetical protein